MLPPRCRCWNRRWPGSKRAAIASRRCAPVCSWSRCGRPAAMAARPVPVPRLVWLCADTTVIGAPCYVTGFGDGTVSRDAATLEQALDAPARRLVALRLVDTLAELHRVDIDRVGLGDLARR